MPKVVSWVFVLFIPFVIFQGSFKLLYSLGITSNLVIYIGVPVFLWIASIYFSRYFGFRYTFKTVKKMSFSDYLFLLVSFGLLMIQSVLYAMPLPSGDSMAGLPQNQMLLLFYLICMPAFEEYFCRFLLVDFIKNKINLSVAVLISTLGFAFAHYDFQAFGCYIVFGLVLLVIRLKYQSLNLNIGLHWLYNLFTAYYQTVLEWYGRSVIDIKVLIFSHYYILILLVIVLAIFFVIKIFMKEKLPKSLVLFLLIGSLVSPLLAYYSPESRMIVAALNNPQSIDNIVLYDAENQMADYEYKYLFEKLLKMLPDDKRFNILILSKDYPNFTPSVSGSTLFINNIKRNAPSVVYFIYKSTFPYKYENAIEGFAGLVDPLFLSKRKSYSDYYKSGGVDFTILNNDDWYLSFLYDYLFEEGKLTSIEEFMEVAKEDRNKMNQIMKTYFIEMSET